MKKNLFLTASLLVVLHLAIPTFSLSIKHASTAPIHLQSESQKEAYLKSLLDFEDRLEGFLKQFDEVSKDGIGKADELWEMDNLERVPLEKAINDERRILGGIREEEKQLLEAKTYSCKNLTQEEIDKLKFYSDNLKKMQEQMSPEGDCIMQSQFSYYLQNSIVTAKNIDKQLSNACYPPKVILPDKFYSNIESAPNAILADLTESQLQERTQELSSENNMIECPSETPYVIDGSCGKCETVYNLSSEVCLEEGCPQNTHLDQEKRQCVDNFRVSALNDELRYVYGNLSEEEFQKRQEEAKNQPDITNCTSDKPFVNSNNECINCAEEEVFDFSKSECVACPEVTEYDKTTHQCEIIPPKVEIDQRTNISEEDCISRTRKWNGTNCVVCELPGYFSGNQCVCPDSYFYNFQIMECRPRKEICEVEYMYWNGSICIACEYPGVFTYKTKTCVCPDGYTYNLDRQKCFLGNGSITFVPNIDNSSTWIYGEKGKESYENYIQQLNSKTYTEECPTDNPFPNANNQCVTCGVGELYDFSTRLCSKCPENSLLDEETHSCISLWEAKERECPEETPFWNGTGCINCQEPGKLINHICDCPEDYHYNWESYTCDKNLIKHIPNFNGDQWTYGNLDEDSYQKSLESTSSEYVLQKCPEDKPFPSNSGECITCPEEMIFDLETGFCVKCPLNQVLNTQTHQCEELKAVTVTCPEEKPFYNGTSCIQCQEPGSFDEESKKCECPENSAYSFDSEECERIPSSLKNSNKDVLNYYGDLPVYDPLLETCDASTPFFDGALCIQCVYPNYFDFIKKKCEVCSQSLIFDISTRTCIAEVKNITKYNSNLEAGDNYCCGTPKKDENLSECPSEKPYFNKIQCVECPSPAYFNFGTLKCQFCLEGQTFSPLTKKCVENKYLEEKIVSNMDTVENYIGEPDKADDAYLNIQKCSKDSPYFNGETCINCRLPLYFNFNEKRCLSCETKWQFNVESKVCEEKKLLEGYKNNYLVGVENFAGVIPIYDPDYETCPSSAPYFAKNECIKCELPKFFNMTSQSCTDCQQDSYFNIINKECEFSNQKFITNIKSDNIYYNGNYQEIIKFYSAKKQGNPDIKDCPNETPFYHARKGQCVSCPEETPLFNMKYNECIECGEESYFDNNKHVCVSNGKVAPTIERMIMNIF